MVDPTPTDATESRALPPEASPQLARLARRAARPFERFFKTEAASGIVLLVAAAVALVWANSPWVASYAALWHARVGIHAGPFAFDHSLEWLVNDGLMAIFFFSVGMEIRKEVYDGELSELRRAALPAVAAFGGMAAPALLYLALANAPETHAGWAIPMATDIAFAVGILALLGKRVPHSLRMLLLALAVIDDLGAILVIAFFYSSGIALSGLLLALVGVLAILLLRWLGVRAVGAYITPAVVVWAGTYASGVHPTIAGVLVGLLTPVRAWRGSAHEAAAAPHAAVSPAEFLIHALHPWVAFGIMPLFALANAGVSLQGLAFSGKTLAVSGGIALGLVLGKPLGVILASWLALRARLCVLPSGLGLRHVILLGVVAGIGFTMSLFIAQLAFADGGLLGAAKLGVFCASGIAIVLGLVLGHTLLRAV